MSKSRYWLSAAALAASTLPAMASVPQAASPAERPASALVARASGLTAADLIVGRDATVAVDVRAQGIEVADTNTNNGC
ncbi:MAG: hypothetical protein ABSC22_20965 [Roseiarcus sp.]